MSTITLDAPSAAEITLLSNHFIDNYMPEANGEFVKVYIYLLRTQSNAPVSFSLEQMADQLLCTEGDIHRALKYWAKMGLLSLEYGEGKQLCGITLLSPGNRPAPVQGESVSSKKETSPAVFTPDRVQELKQNEEIVQLLYITEKYLGKTLTSTETQKILFFYDELKFSADLIEYLIEYCVGKNHKSFRYIETVAMAWAKEGITSVQEAKNAVSHYGKEYFTILRAMGITGRSPADTEISLMDTWLKQYGFSLEIIQEACSRTILKTGQPSFQYADRILSDWKKKNVHSMKDIQAIDAAHKKNQQEKPVSRRTAAAHNRFHNFQQREYNFEEYEKQLLNQQE